MNDDNVSVVNSKLSGMDNNEKITQSMTKRRRKRKVDKDFISFSVNDDNISMKSENLSDSNDTKCKECGKEFNDSISLRKHIVTHGEKQFPCPYQECSKKFLDNSKLRRHILVHTVRIMLI